MNPRLTLLPLLALLAVGCGKEPAADTTAATTTPAATTATTPGNPDAVPQTGVVKGGPDAGAAPGAAYRIQPPANDPRFKPDPKLAGGG